MKNDSLRNFTSEKDNFINEVSYQREREIKYYIYFNDSINNM